MPDPQHDARRRLLIALALERARGPIAVDGALRRALGGDRRDAPPADSPSRAPHEPGDDVG